MSNAKTELFTYLAAAFATLIGLFMIQRVYGAVIDVNYHKRLAEAGPYESVTAARKADQEVLQKGKIPVDQAIAKLAHNRATIGSIAPQPSQDLSAISGWIYFPGFKPVVAHPIRGARAPITSAAPKATEPPAADPIAAPEAAASDKPAKSGAKPTTAKTTKPASGKPAQTHE
jgi:hypothetical protein